MPLKDLNKKTPQKKKDHSRKSSALTNRLLSIYKDKTESFSNSLSPINSNSFSRNLKSLKTVASSTCMTSVKKQTLSSMRKKKRATSHQQLPRPPLPLDIMNKMRSKSTPRLKVCFPRVIKIRL